MGRGSTGRAPIANETAVTAAPGLIDEVLPDADTSVTRTVVVEAPPDRVFAAILAADLSASPFVRFVRPSTGWIGRWRRAVPTGGRVPLGIGDLHRHGLPVVAERPGEGIVLGGIVRPSVLYPRPQRLPADLFVAFGKSGYVKVAIGLAATARLDGMTHLSCEARFRALDEESRRRLRRGWRIGRLLVSLAQRGVLRVIRDHATAEPVPAQAG